MLNNAEYSTVNKYWIQILNVFFNKITKKRLNKKNTANKYSSILSNGRHQPFQNNAKYKRKIQKCDKMLPCSKKYTLFRIPDIGRKKLCKFSDRLDKTKSQILAKIHKY